MVISKCVPMEISRKRFSDFVKRNTPDDMVFVGWKYDENDLEEDLSKKKKINVQLHYNQFKDGLRQWIEENGGFGTQVLPNSETIYRPLTEETWNEEYQTHVVNLNNQKGFIEINGGGEYTDECVFFLNPLVGCVTNIVIDNTGRNHTIDEPYDVWKPVSDFTFMYGLGKDVSPQILSVPPYARGVVQILHTQETDVVMTATYTDANEFEHTEEASYFADVIPSNELDNNADPIQGEVEYRDDKHYVDMKDEQGFVEISTSDNINEYTFVFQNSELGTMSYIVLDNTNGSHEVTVNYGKVMSDGTNDIEYNITLLERGEKAIIQVFHSLSVDVVVNVTII